MSVIGPISKKDWDSLVLLKSSLEYCKRKNVNGNLNATIALESEYYKGLLDKYKR